VLQTGGVHGTALIAAVINSDLDMVQTLLDAGADKAINATDGEGWTVLHYACAEGRDASVARLLIEQGADVNAGVVPDLREAVTPASLACYYGRKDVLSVLLEREETDLDLGGGDNQQRPLRVAIETGKAEMVSMLLDTGRCSTDGKFSDGRNALTAAVATAESLETLNVLLEKTDEAGKPLDPNLHDPSGYSPLQHAAILGHVGMINRLVEAGAAISGESASDISAGDNDVDMERITPLQLAAAWNRHDAVRLLCEKHGADVNETLAGQCGMTALYMAIEAADLEMVELLLDLGADITILAEDSQETFFDVVCRRFGHDEEDSDNEEENEEERSEKRADQEVDDKEKEEQKKQDQDARDAMLWLLVQRGCFRSNKTGPRLHVLNDDSDCHKETDLFEAAFDGSTAKVQDSLDGLPDPPSVASRQLIEEALRVASARGHVALVSLLVRQPGIQINARDVTERTALHHAAMHLHWQVCALLTAKGASVSLEDKIGSTPIDLAVSNGMEGLGFIQENMDSLVLAINRRPSLLASLASNPPDKLSPTQVRDVISGSWSGYFERIAWPERGAYVLEIPARPSAVSREMTTFSGKNKDHAGEFHFHGFVDPAGIVWFVKLYKKHGWLYRGRLAVDQDSKIMRGTWGTNKKLWLGTFEVAKKEEGN